MSPPRQGAPALKPSGPIRKYGLTDGGLGVGAGQGIVVEPWLVVATGADADPYATTFFVGEMVPFERPWPAADGTEEAFLIANNVGRGGQGAHAAKLAKLGPLSTLLGRSIRVA
jgi:hypothetical protein